MSSEQLDILTIDFLDNLIIGLAAFSIEFIKAEWFQNQLVISCYDTIIDQYNQFVLSKNDIEHLAKVGTNPTNSMGLIIGLIEPSSFWQTFYSDELEDLLLEQIEFETNFTHSFSLSPSDLDCYIIDYEAHK